MLQVLLVSFSSSGRFLISSSLDKTARMWNPVSGEELRQFIGDTEWVSHLLLHC